MNDRDKFDNLRSGFVLLDGTIIDDPDRDPVHDLLDLEGRGRLVGHPGMSAWAGGDLDYPAADDTEPWTLDVPGRSDPRD